MKTILVERHIPAHTAPHPGSGNMKKFMILHEHYQRVEHHRPAHRAQHPGSENMTNLNDTTLTLS
jgi:hypothetical protein